MGSKGLDALQRYLNFGMPGLISTWIHCFWLRWVFFQPGLSQACIADAVVVKVELLQGCEARESKGQFLSPCIIPLPLVMISNQKYPNLCN